MRNYWFLCGSKPLGINIVLQMLVDVPHQQLASAMGFQEKAAQDLQETLQRVLDRRDEERQSKELLQLYLNAVAKEKEQDKTSQARMALTLYAFWFFFDIIS